MAPKSEWDPAVTVGEVFIWLLFFPGGLHVTAATQLRSTAMPVNHWSAFAVLAVAYFMTIVDLTIVNVALPTIGRKLHFSEANLQWVVTAYGVAFGGFLLLGGRAADLLGRRSVLMVGLAVFRGTSPLHRMPNM